MSAIDNWSANWCADKFKHDKISGVRAVENNLIEVKAEEIGVALVATMSFSEVSLPDIPQVAHRQDVEFIVNIKKDVLFQGDLIGFADINSKGLGGIADLSRAINQGSLREYVSPERAFLSRALSQHSAVAGVQMLNNKTYYILRQGMEAYQFLALDAYDLTANVVRDGLRRFGHSRTILKSNPNGNITPEAREAAKNSSTKIFTFAQLLGALNG